MIVAIASKIVIIKKKRKYLFGIIINQKTVKDNALFCIHNGCLSFIFPIIMTLGKIDENINVLILLFMNLKKNCGYDYSFFLMSKQF